VPLHETSDLWWKHAIVYCLDVETFCDGNGDGIGDFEGLTGRIDYLAGLGVTCIWLMPFFPTPDRDDGYDITEFYGVDERLGSLGDLVRFVRTARERGIRVIADLVINHTSAAHRWFRAARSDRDAPHRDWYVWVDEPPEDGPKDLVFPDEERSNWEYDDGSGQYYLHRFYTHQPDLNVGNPRVRDEIAKIAGFWLELGLSGFRIDAVPFFLEATGIETELKGDPHDVLRDLRAVISRRRGDAMLLGEVNLPPADLQRYFDNQLQMAFNFLGNQALYLSLVRADAQPLRDALRSLPEIPEEGQWANFVRNHDELSLDKLSEDERAEVFAAFGPEEHMQLYGRGLRRRLPPMLDGDQRRMRLVYSLLLSLPGTPVLFYGEEIGMAENLEIEGRGSVRAPMQWAPGPQAGFSSAPPERLRNPVVQGGYGPDRVNVADQRRDPDSLLNWMERLIRRRKECPELGFGTWSVLDVDVPAVFAHRCDWDGRSVVAVHNLGPEDCTVRLPLDGGLHDLLSDQRGPDPGEVELGGYGYRWFRFTGRR
jgi:trehalose synthase